MSTTEEDLDLIQAWLDDDVPLRIPDTHWGRSLYAAISALVAAQREEAAS